MNKNKCKDCMYSIDCQPNKRNDDFTNIMRCHRYPPQYIGHNNIQFPLVNKDDFCGEFKKGKEEN